MPEIEAQGFVDSLLMLGRIHTLRAEDLRFQADIHGATIR